MRYRVRENGTAAAQPQVMRGDGVLAGGMAQYCRSADHPCATPGDALLEIKTDFSNANTRAGRRICDKPRSAWGSLRQGKAGRNNKQVQGHRQ